MRASWMIGAIGASVFACDRPTPEAVPKPPTALVSPVDAVRPVMPEAPAELLAERPIPTATRGPEGRGQAVISALAHVERGEFGQAFKYLAGEIVWTEIGMPDGELESVPEIVAFHEKARAGLSDFRVRARRILESGDYQVVEYVWSARHSGALEDGTAATNKTIVLPAAMMLRYREDGLVDRVWVFQDWPNALQQLGLAPDMPRAPEASTMPESTEVILGPSAASYRDAYDLLDVQRIDGFERSDTTFNASIDAGPYFAAFVTNELVYGGGFMGVPADGQRITTHTLDVVRFDPETLRLETLVSYGNSLEVLSALGITAGTASRPE